MGKILLIDDDEGLIHFLKRFFERKGHVVTACGDGLAAMDILGRLSADLILLDYKLPQMNGLDTLTEIKKMDAKTPVILMTAYGTTDLAIEAMKRGAYDYLIKPFDRKELSRISADALLVSRQMKETVLLPFPEGAPEGQDRGGLRIIGASRQMREIYKRIGQIAESDVSVLITGESGTGKELAARAIYHHSRRHDNPFIAINCAAIPETLFESELFGHERGAFTGADRISIGKIERCDNGTLFLDEIGEMPLAMQTKLLRVLQEGEIERLGGNRTIRVNARIIAATNKNLEAETAAGRFRNDLYWRLKVITIDMPPLRQRIEDIPALVDYFLTRFSEEYQRPVWRLSDAALAKLSAYDWPGNVRELENCIRRAVILSAGGVIAENNLTIPGGQSAISHQAMRGEDWMAKLKQQLDTILPEILRLSSGNTHAQVIDMTETILIEKSVELCGGNQVQAARMLGVSRNTLRDRLKKKPENPDLEASDNEMEDNWP
jgi:DNA-binding NtrC family response regulator